MFTIQTAGFDYVNSSDYLRGDSLLISSVIDTIPYDLDLWFC